MTTPRIEELKKEARNRFNPYLYRFLTQSQKEQHEADINFLITYVYTAAIDDCIEALPGKAGEHVQNTNIIAGWNGLRTIAIECLQALKSSISNEE